MLAGVGAIRSALECVSSSRSSRVLPCAALRLMYSDRSGGQLPLHREFVNTGKVAVVKLPVRASAIHFRERPVLGFSGNL